MTDHADITTVALQVRRALERLPATDYPSTWSGFPRGTCGDTALVLGAFLVDKGIKEFLYVSGERGSQFTGDYTSHAWLARGNLVIDITADQFADAPGAVIVARHSNWHTTFSAHAPTVGDFRKYPVQQVIELHRLYAKLKPIL
jgi:hypothetical protein